MEVTLVPQCDLEVAEGTAFSIGTQSLDVLLNDPCECVLGVLINGVPAPAEVGDGDEIVVSLELDPACHLDDESAPACRTPLALRVSRPDGTRKTYLNMAGLLPAPRRRATRR